MLRCIRILILILMESLLVRALVVVVAVAVAMVVVVVVVVVIVGVQMLVTMGTKWGVGCGLTAIQVLTRALATTTSNLTCRPRS